MASDISFFIGQIMGVGLILFWCYSAWVTGSFVGAAVVGPFVKEPKKQEDPIPTPAKRPKKLTFSVEEACEILGISLSMLKSYIVSADVRTYREGVELRLDADDINKLKNKPPKRVFPVIDDFKEEHKITNPVEFDD